MAINTLYTDNGVMKSARRAFESQTPKNIRLENFFQKPVFRIIQKKLYLADYTEKFDPEKYFYSVTTLKEIDTFLKGRYFQDIVLKATGKKALKMSYGIRKFERGNYTLLHDAEKEKPGIDFIIDFSRQCRNFGGYIKYLTSGEELLQFDSVPNTLSFVKRKKGVMKYTKYLQHRQKFPIIHVIGTIFD